MNTNIKKLKVNTLADNRTLSSGDGFVNNGIFILIVYNITMKVKHMLLTKTKIMSVRPHISLEYDSILLHISLIFSGLFSGYSTGYTISLIQIAYASLYCIKYCDRKTPNNPKSRTRKTNKLIMGALRW